MKEGTPFPKKAAYFCLASPFITAIVQNLTKQPESTRISELIVLILMYGILLMGIILGIYSLFHFKKVKGIIAPALIGLLLHVLIIYIAYGAFVNYRNRSAYFLIHSFMDNNEINYDQIILGRIHPDAPMDKYIKSTADGIIRSCPSCRIIKTENYETLPEKFKGIFEGSQIDYTYISIDTKKKGIGDMRFIFPSFDPQLSCQDLSDFINQRKQVVGDNGDVTCTEAKLLTKASTATGR